MLKTEWCNLLWSEKLSIIGKGLIATGLGMTCIDGYLSRRIPYTYRSTVLDAIDYMACKNIFNRKESLQ